MIIDATFWVAVSFFIFVGVLIYLKTPQKINSSLSDKINEIKKELENAEKLKEDAKNLLSDYENKIDNSKKETKKIIDLAKNESEKNLLNRTKKFHISLDERKKNAMQKIYQMKQDALEDIKKISITVAIEAVENLINNSVDKKKLDILYSKSLEKAKVSLKQSKA